MSVQGAARLFSPVRYGIGAISLVESSSDFDPIRSWANELRAKDTSRKVRSVKRMQAENGERLGGKPPYGYRKRDGDSKHLVL